ncbi:MAG: hypothetical protein OEW00_14355 [candidate division Zixibacteria bacterium]|nr:hypothetical protein [candidate division Zixibacteria bacterium]
MKESARTAVVTALLSAILVVALTDDSRSEQAYTIRGKEIMRRSVPEGRVTPFMTARGVRVTQLQIADSTAYAAVISQQYLADSSVPGQPGAFQEIKSILEICDSTGAMVLERDFDVQRIGFSPDGRHLAFISGRQLVEGRDFIPQAVGIIDIAAGTETWVPGIFDSATTRVHPNIFWANDGVIYVNDEDYEIVKIDSKSLEVSPTGLTGMVYLSPDGRFNLINATRWEKGDYIEIIDLVNRMNISPDIYQLIGESLDLQDYGTELYAGWLGNTGSMLGINLGERALVIDVAGRNLLFDEPFSDIDFNPGAWVGAGSAWLVVENHKVMVFDRSRLAAPGE